MKIKRSVSIVTGILETFSIGGILFGWSSFNYVLVKEGYFNSSCEASLTLPKNDSSKTLCPHQQYMLELVFTLGIIIPLLILPVVGLFFNLLGTWILRICFSFLVIISCLSIAFSTPKISWILFPAAIFLTTGGFGLYATNLQTANLFPTFRGLILNFQAGALTASMTIFTFAKLAYQGGISVEAIFLFLTFLGFLAFARTFFLMPRNIIPYNVSQDFDFGIKECCFETEESNAEETDRLLENENNTDSNDWSPFTDLRSSILNSYYLLAVFSFSIQSLRINFFVEELNSWLYPLLEKDTSLYGLYINVFGYLQLAALICAPLSGLLLDYVRFYYTNKTSLTQLQATLRPISIVCFLGSGMSIVYSLLMLIPSDSLQFVTFVFTVFANVIYTANLNVLILQLFPMNHFVTLLGLGVLISASATTLQYPLLYVAIQYFQSKFFAVNMIVLLLVIATLVHPINLYLHSKQ